MKILLFILSICFLVSCSKSSSTNSNNNTGNTGNSTNNSDSPTVSYSAQATTTSWTIPATAYKVDSNISCAFQEDSTSADSILAEGIYIFDFNQIEGTTDFGLTFILPARNYPSFQFPLNTPITMNYNTSVYSQIILLSAVVFTSTEYIGPCDSTNFTLTITRNSNNTIDGTFSANYYEGISLQAQPTGIGMVTSGVFKNAPLKTK